MDEQRFTINGVDYDSAELRQVEIPATATTRTLWDVYAGTAKITTVVLPLDGVATVSASEILGSS